MDKKMEFSRQIRRLTINDCNDDVLMCIFNNLNFDDRIRLMRVCKRWYSLITYQLQSTKCMKIGYFLENSTATTNHHYNTITTTNKTKQGLDNVGQNVSNNFNYNILCDIDTTVLNAQNQDISTITLLSQMNKQIMAHSRSQLINYIQPQSLNCLTNSTNNIIDSNNATQQIYLTESNNIIANRAFQQHSINQNNHHDHHHQQNDICKQRIDQEDDKFIVDDLLSKYSVHYEFDMVCGDFNHIRLASPNTNHHHQQQHSSPIRTSPVNTTARSVAKLFNRSLFQFPADLQTQCFYVSRYDYLHRSLKMCSQTLTMLSLGHIILDYRCFVSLVFNCPNVEHLELVGCATDPESNHPLTDAAQNYIYETDRSEVRPHSIEDMIRRNQMIKNCSLVRDGKRWFRMKHLLIKHCDNLSESMIGLLLTITENSLLHLSIQSNQYLTGDCLKYCSASLKILELKFCPSMQQRPLEDLIKLKYLTSGKNDHLRQRNSITQNDVISDTNKQRTNFNELIGLSVEYCQLIKMDQLINCTTQYCPSIVSLTLDPVTEENGIKKLVTLKHLKYVKLNANKHYQAFCLSDRCVSSSHNFQQSTANRRQIVGS